MFLIMEMLSCVQLQFFLIYLMFDSRAINRTEKSHWLFVLLGCFFVILMGVFLNAYQARAFVTLTSVQPSAAGQNLTSLTNADYDVRLEESSAPASFVSKILVVFPLGYTVSGTMLATDICESSSCASPGYISGFVGMPAPALSQVSHISVTGTTITINMVGTFQANGFSFTIRNGITNPSTGGSYGSFTVESRTAGDGMIDHYSDSPYVTIPEPSASSTIITIANGDNEVTQANADYHVEYHVTNVMSVSDITITFPAAYVIADGLIATSNICDDDACSNMGYVSMNGSTNFASPVSSMTGNMMNGTIKLHFNTPLSFNASYIDFAIVGGITNPAISGMTDIFLVTSPGVNIASAGGVNLDSPPVPGNGSVTFLDGQGTSGLANADYHVQYSVTGFASVADLNIVFPVGYVIADGSIPVTDICPDDTCASNLGHVNKSGFPDLDSLVGSVTGNADTRTIGIHFSSAVTFNTNTIDFVIRSGITNPGSGLTGTFGILANGVTDVDAAGVVITVVQVDPLAGLFSPLPGQNTAGLADADYHISAGFTNSSGATQIVLSFPSGYVITPGIIPTTSICNNDACSIPSAVNVNDVVGPSVDMVVGNTGARTITIDFSSVVDLSAGQLDFKILSGITNPTHSELYGSYSITSSSPETITTIPSQLITFGDFHHAQFSDSIPDQTAGTPFVLPAIEIVDLYENRITNIDATDKILVYVLSGEDASPNGNNPQFTGDNSDVSDTVDFTNGLSTTVLTTTLYRAAPSVTLKVYAPDSPDSDGANATLSNVFAVSSSTLNSLDFPGFTDQMPFMAGDSYVSVLHAVDDYGNTVPSYTGAKTITFMSDDSPDGVVPTVSLPVGDPTVVGTPLSVNFTDGVSDVSLSFVFYKAGENSFHVSDGVDFINWGCDAGPDCISVQNQDAAALRVRTQDGFTALSAGVAKSMLVYVIDAYGNVVAGTESSPYSYTDTKGLKFIGPSVIGESTPKLYRDGIPETVIYASFAEDPDHLYLMTNFVNGVSDVLELVAYKAESFHMDVRDNTTLTTVGVSSHGVDLTVSAGTLNHFGIAVSDSTPTTGVPINVTVSALDLYGNSFAYTGLVILSTSATTPYTISPSIYHFVLGDGGVKTFINAFTFNTAETVSVTVEDFSDVSASQAGIVVSDAVVPLAVTRIDSIKSFATADGTFANGFAWILHATVPTSETALKLKFSDFLSGSNTIAATNIRYCSAQSNKNCASGAEEGTDYISVGGAGQSYDAITAVTLASDLDAGTVGRQVQIRVEMKVPDGTAGGSYSGSYGIQSN